MTRDSKPSPGFNRREMMKLSASGMAAMASGGISAAAQLPLASIIGAKESQRLLDGLEKLDFLSSHYSPQLLNLDLRSAIEKTSDPAEWDSFFQEHAKAMRISIQHSFKGLKEISDAMDEVRSSFKGDHPIALYLQSRDSANLEILRILSRGIAAIRLSPSISEGECEYYIKEMKQHKKLISALLRATPSEREEEISQLLSFYEDEQQALNCSGMVQEALRIRDDEPDRSVRFLEGLNLPEDARYEINELLDDLLIRSLKSLEYFDDRNSLLLNLSPNRTFKALADYLNYDIEQETLKLKALSPLTSWQEQVAQLHETLLNEVKTLYVEHRGLNTADDKKKTPNQPNKKDDTLADRSQWLSDDSQNVYAAMRGEGPKPFQERIRDLSSSEKGRS